MNKINVQSKNNLTGGKIIKLEDMGELPVDSSASEALLLPAADGYKIIPLRRDMKKLYYRSNNPVQLYLHHLHPQFLEEMKDQILYNLDDTMLDYFLIGQVKNVSY